MRTLLILLMALTPGCASTEYRFEQIDGEQPVSLPLKLDGFYGVRDGAVVKAQANFAGGNDAAVMNIVVFLRPPAEFQSGTYQASIGGQVTSGTVECPSLSFQGGQTALPAVGGLFLLKDEQGRMRYRVRIPANTLTSRP